MTNLLQNSAGLPSGALTLKHEIAGGRMVHHATLPVGAGYRIEVRQGVDSLWFLLKRNGKGGLALRTAWAPGPPLKVETFCPREDFCEFRASSAVGAFRVTVRLPVVGQPLIHVTTSVIPNADLLLDYWPRDLYAIDAAGDPTVAVGQVAAAQRGVNAGLVYATLVEPAFGSFLYWQDFTRLNDYFRITATRPDGVVGGEWPELGYKMPVSEARPLPHGREVILSDVYLHATPESEDDERATALRFIDLLAGIYPHLTMPETRFHPWPRLAAETVRDLKASPKATLKEHGYRYLRPYTDAEYPDSMVQLTVLIALREYARWRNEPLPLADELRAGVRHFFDIELGTMRRYLPSVGEDKDASKVDSWYLYHPLINLARLAEEEKDAEARDLLLGSLPYAIKVAHRFNYTWPILFRIDTLEVIQAERQPGQPGQSDVGGIYAHLMLQAYDLTGDTLYFEEARKAIHATRGLAFNLTYQTNLTAYGLLACLKLHRLTGDAFFRDQAWVFLASYFHNCVLWESEIGNAERYPEFFGATCLHDGPYMAPYECAESFAAFHKILTEYRAALPESVALLLAEFCRFTLNRAWYFFPDHLPADSLATEIRNGHIDRLLAFPVEDLYADGQLAGQVGQEIYGSGIALALTSRAFRKLKNAPYLLFSEYPLTIRTETDDSAAFVASGLPQSRFRIRVIPETEVPVAGIRLETPEGEVIGGQVTPEGHCEFPLNGGAEFVLRWRNSE
ncbi:MAG: hypothetical protein SFU56_16740 [Capsulimonadales bacterium]|nr:hypothetical protein [Capsulimonadales bacterium]